jgi:hypothetical protein
MVRACILTTVAGTLAVSARLAAGPGLPLITYPKVEVALAKTNLVAGENVEITVTLENPLDKEVEVTPLQPFGFLELNVEENGKRVPNQLKVTLEGLDKDTVIGPKKFVSRRLDLCTWFPLGLYAGEFDVGMIYYPNRNDRSVTVKSGAVRVRVDARTPVQEKEYNQYVEILRSSGGPDLQLVKKFLEEHPGSMYEPRVRLFWAGAVDLKAQGNVVADVLGAVFASAAPTKAEMDAAADLRSRSLMANNRDEEALAVLEGVEGGWASQRREVLRKRLSDRKPAPGGSPGTA